jgi:hypothetical protein
MPVNTLPVVELDWTEVHADMNAHDASFHVNLSKHWPIYL